MVPSEGWGGDPAERGESTSVSRCARSDGICPTRRHPDDEARPAAHTPAARTAGEGGSRRRVVPGEMRGKGAPADGVQEAAPTCGCHIERYRYHDTVPRRPVSVADDAEGTSAPGAEEAVRTCGHYTDTAPRRPTPSTVLGFKRGLQNKCDEMRVEVSRGGVPTDGFQESVARCGFRNPSLVRRCPMPPGRDTTRCAQMGAASSCVPVPTGARGGGGGRGHRDTHDDYAGTSRSRAAQLHAPTADLPAEMYDTGSIVGPSGSSTVNNVQVFAGYVLHIGSFMEGPDSKALSVGDEVKCKEVLGDLIDQKGSIVLPEKQRFDFSHGKPVQPEDLRKNESIVKQQIEAELEVSAQEIKLADAKHINGLRAVFGEIYPDPVRVVSIGRKVEDVLPNPESKEWLSISTELCGGTPISNTRDAEAFSLISEEDIAKGVRRITAATAECASQAMKLASSIETDINEASKLDGATLEKKIGSINNTLDAAAIPAARKADLKGNVSKLEVRAAELHAPTSDLPAKNDDTLLSEAIDECFEVGPVEKDAGKKGLSTIGEEVKQLAQRASDNSLKPQDYEAFSEVPDFVCSDMGGCPGSKGKWNYISKMNYYLRAGEASSSSSTSSSTNRSAGNTTQILVKFCGSTIPVQKNLNQLSTNMLIEHVCLRVGVRHNNLYSTFCGKILEPKQVLSYYQLQKDSTVYINPRLRGGRLLTIDFETWDDKMKDCPRDQTVVLHPDLIGPDNRRRKVNTVTYLSESLQYLAKQVLIGMCRNHFIGISFGGNFTSEHLLFDRGNFKFDDCIPIDEYSRRSALKDYDRISEIFDKAFRAGNKPYPMHAGHLINFLARTPPLVDPKSEAVIAYLTNHYSLLSHSQRIKTSEVLDSLREMLGGTDFLNFKFAIGKTYWTGRIEQITAMKGVYFYHAKWNKFGALIYIPYVDNDNASLLHFSDNFFKHARYPLQQLEAAFSLAMERENFMPTLLLDCMIKFRNVVELSGPVGVKYCCSVVVEEFIKEVISMLGKNTLCCKRSDEASTS